MVACPDFQVFQRMLETHKGHISYLSASECKPCPQPCQSPSGHLSVQPHTCGGTGSSSSLSPASIAEDVFFNSTNEDQVTVYTSDWNHFPFFRSSFSQTVNIFDTQLIVLVRGEHWCNLFSFAQNILLISLPPFFSLLPFSGSILPPRLPCWSAGHLFSSQRL